MVLYYAIPKKWRVPAAVAIVPVGAFLNGVLNLFNEAMTLPLFLDSVFTIAVAALFGLVPGLATGLATNLVLELFRGFPGTHWPFAIVNMLTALVVAIMAKRGGFDTLRGAIGVLFALTLVNAVAGTVVVSFVFGGISNETIDYVVRAIALSGRSLFSSAFIARLLINFVDKGVAVIATFALWAFVRRRLGRAPETTAPTYSEPTD
jgi:energy-coupling factor transport system substrate-specific component